MPQPAATGTDVPKLGLMLAAAEHVAGRGSEGVVVVDIDPRGLASEHGFKAGDIILDVGGKKVVSPVDVRNAIRDAQMNGKRAVLMRLKSDEVTRISSAFRSLASNRVRGVPAGIVTRPAGTHAGDRAARRPRRPPNLYCRRR